MSKLYKDDISENASDALADLFIIVDWAKEQEIELDEALSIFMSNMNDTSEYKKGLRELGEKGFINIKWSEDEMGIQFSDISITLKGRLYFFKYLERTGRYSVGYAEHEKSIDDVIKKFTTGGIYVLVTATIAIIIDLINMLLEVYKTFH